MKIYNATFLNVPCHWCNELQSLHLGDKCLFGHSTYQPYCVRSLRMGCITIGHYGWEEGDPPAVIEFGVATINGCASPERMWKLTIIEPGRSFPLIRYIPKDFGDLIEQEVDDGIRRCP